MDRRKFVAAAGLAGATGLLSACGKKDATQTTCDEQQSTETFEWKMVTTWPRDFPGLGTGANYLARIIGEMSDGRLTVYIGGGGGPDSKVNSNRVAIFSVCTPTTRSAAGSATCTVRPSGPTRYSAGRGTM